MIKTLMTKLLPLVLAIFLSVSVSVSASHSSSRATAHKSLAKRFAGDLSILKNLNNLFTDARWTFFDAGLGACGEVNDDYDFIVALNAIQFGLGYPGPQCFKKIIMEYNGKKATATIMDMCPECPYGALDLSRSLFQYFAPEDIGIIYGKWYFVDDSDDSDDGDDDHDHDGPPHHGDGNKSPEPPKSKPKPKPKPKTKPKPTHGKVHRPPTPPPPVPPKHKSAPKNKSIGEKVLDGALHSTQTHAPDNSHHLSQSVSAATSKKQQPKPDAKKNTHHQVPPSSASHSTPATIRPNGNGTNKNKNVVVGGNGLPPLNITPATTRPNGSSTNKNVVVGNGLPPLKSASSKAAPIVKGTALQSEFGSSDSDSQESAENLAALNKVFRRLGSIAAAGSTVNRFE